jgi:hypothetical protein
MKKITFLVVLAFVSLNFLSLNATVWTVSNRADKPAQFTTIQAAIDVAQPGDTILIAGSSSMYNAFTLNRKLVFLGEGMNNPDGQNTSIAISIGGYGGSTMYLININSSIGASGSKFYGIAFCSFGPYYGTFNFYGSFIGQQTGENKIENIEFNRCSFIIPITFNSQIYNNISFKNCLFNSSINLGSSTFNNLVITNCIFTYPNDVQIISGNNVNGQVFIRNCIFMNNTTNGFNAAGLVVENSVFFAGSPTGATVSTFNNNITFGNNNNTLPYGTNVGSGNIIGVNPQFVNYSPVGGPFAWNYDFALQPGSPCIGTGTNNTNIGLTGGNAPLAHNLPPNSKLPVVTSVTVPVSSVPVGGTLQINIKAKTRQ